MIEREEIESQAERMGVHRANVERDYVFGWLLKAFDESDYLARRLVFKGGNCMRKAFYSETRFSSDLDFSVQAAIDVDQIQTEINRACLVAQGACGVQFETERNSLKADAALDNERQSYKGRVYFRDFYGNSDSLIISIRIDLTEFDRIYLPTVTRALIHPYSDATGCRADLECMALEELLANKLKCLMQRRHSFDLYDLVYATFFERSIHVDRPLLLSTFLKKTIFERSPGAAKEILLGLPMAFFRAAWDKYVTPIASRFDFDRAENGFRDSIEAIFEGIAPHSWRSNPFYPSNYRNLIMEAGSGKRLLAVTYDDGRERLVEPYALTYKRKKDGDAAEYFYVWDRTGGRSGPGLKTFLHRNVQRLEITDQVFEPRYPVELAKAGERTSKEDFGRDFSKRRPSVSRRRSASRRPSRPASSGPRANPFGITYKVECPYCQKRFKRDRPKTVLNPHKDANGYPCGGRTGYLVY